MTTCDETTHEENTIQVKSKKKKKKDKKKEKKILGETIDHLTKQTKKISESPEQVNDPPKKKKKKKGEEVLTLGETNDSDSLTPSSTTINSPLVNDHLKKGSRKRKKRLAENNTLEVLPRDISVNKLVDQGNKKKKKKHKNDLEIHISSEQEVINCPIEDESSKEHKKKKKKLNSKKREKEDISQSLPSSPPAIKDEELAAEIEKKKNKKKKKKQKQKEGLEEATMKSDTIAYSSEGPNDMTAAGDPSKMLTKEKKKSKKRKSTQSPVQNDHNDSSESGPDCGDAKSPQSKRKRKDGDSSESQPKGHVSSVRVGQWGTATFNDNKMQSKFLRLLGGFKKIGNEPTGVAENGVNTKDEPKGIKFNMALGKSEANALNKALEDQFHKALDFKLNTEKGIGLGFKPPPGQGKKFYIDSNKSLSKKFD